MHGRGRHGRKTLTESETNAKEKKGVSAGDHGPDEAVIWGLFKSHLWPSRCRTLSHAGAESGETGPLSPATVAGPKYLIAFLLLHAGLYRLLNGDSVPSSDLSTNPTPSQQSGEPKKRVPLKMGSRKTQ